MNLSIKIIFFDEKVHLIITADWQYMHLYVPAHVHTHTRAHYTRPTQIGRHTQIAYLLTWTYQVYTFVLKVRLVETWISIKKFTFTGNEKTMGKSTAVTIRSTILGATVISWCSVVKILC